MVGNPHYLYRMTVLVALAALAPAVSHDVLCQSMLPVVVSCAKDKVRPQAASGRGVAASDAAIGLASRFVVHVVLGEGLVVLNIAWQSSVGWGCFW